MNEICEKIAVDVFAQTWKQLVDCLKTDEPEKKKPDKARSTPRQTPTEIFASIWKAVKGDLKSQLNDQIYGSHDAGWLSFYAYMRDVVGMECCKSMDGLIELAECCGWWAPYRNVAILQHRPEEIYRNDRGLHRDGGPAVLYRDGFAVWSMNGTRVPQWLAETPSEQLDPKKLLEIQNAQIRAEFVRKVGAERLIHKLGGVVIDKDGEYELLELKFEFAPETVRALKMHNPSVPELWHVEFVPPDCATVAAALAFRNGTTAAPDVLT